MNTLGYKEVEINPRKGGFETPYLKIMMKRYDEVEKAHIRLDLYKRSLTSDDKDPDMLSKYAKMMLKSQRPRI